MNALSRLEVALSRTVHVKAHERINPKSGKIEHVDAYTYTIGDRVTLKGSFGTGTIVSAEGGRYNVQLDGKPPGQGVLNVHEGHILGNPYVKAKDKAAFVNARAGPQPADAAAAAAVVAAAAYLHGEKFKVPATVEELDALRDQWAGLDRELLKYVGSPSDPNCKRIMEEQRTIMKAIHHANLDPGGPEGVGKPGGPRDVVIIGSGPAGLAAAIYGGTEGLDTLLVDAGDHPGGQAAYSSRIENVMGFPAGVTGRQLAEISLGQAERVGAECEFNKRCTGIEFDTQTGLKVLTFSDGTVVETRSVILAGGVQPRTLKFPGDDANHIVYLDSTAMKEVKGKAAVIVGGANSAAQAAVDAAGVLPEVHMLIHGNDMSKGMSDYLVTQIEGAPNIHVHYNSEVASAEKDGKGDLSAVVLKDGSTIPAGSLGFFIGSVPKAAWAGVELDNHGFVITGKSGVPLETSIPGVYAAGDIRSGTVKRVATASGEGAYALASTHDYLPTVKARLSADAGKTVNATPDDTADTNSALMAAYDAEHPVVATLEAADEPIKPYSIKPHGNDPARQAQIRKQYPNAEFDEQGNLVRFNTKPAPKVKVVKPGQQPAEPRKGWPQPEPFSDAISPPYPTQEERDQVNDYQNSGDYELNRKLRRYHRLDPDERAKFKILKGLSDKTVTTKPITLYRMVGGPAEAHGKPDFIPDAGKEFVDLGFISTEYEQNYTAEAHIGDRRAITIEVPAGTHLVDVDHAAGWEGMENEVLLPPGTKFKVTSKTDNHIEMRVVPSGGAVEKLKEKTSARQAHLGTRRHSTGGSTAASQSEPEQPKPPAQSQLGGAGEGLDLGPAFAGLVQPGDVVYRHKVGSIIIVKPDGSLTKYSAAGKKNPSTSATVEKLAAGHGAWQRITALPGPVQAAPVQDLSTINFETAAEAVVVAKPEIEAPSVPAPASAKHHVPMLFNEAPVTDIPKYAADPNWFFQQKVDGIRSQLVIAPGQKPWFRSKSGEQAASSTTAKIEKPILSKLGTPGDGPNYIVDGEMLDGKWYVFDLNVEGEKMPWQERMQRAEAWVATVNAAGINNIVALPTARTQSEKLAMAAAVRNNGGEGVMMKRADAPYNFDQRVNHTLKAKFVSTADVVVTSLNPGGKDSITVGAHDENGNLIPLGTVSKLGKEKQAGVGTLKVGDVIEVAYLYSTEKGTLYQPRIIRSRPDAKPAQATTAQLRKVNKEVLEAGQVMPGDIAALKKLYPNAEFDAQGNVIHWT